MKNSICNINDRNEPNYQNVFAGGRALIFLIMVYQRTVGMLMPRVCRFEPTCSQYSIEAIREHGVFRGLYLSAWRIMRCNPWCQGGHDPVPVNKTKKVYRHIRISASGYQGIRVSGNDINEHNDLNVLARSKS